MSFLTRASIARQRVLPVSCARPQNSQVWLHPPLARGISTGCVPKGHISAYTLHRPVTRSSLPPYNSPRHPHLSSSLSLLTRLGLRRSYCTLRPMSVPPARSATAQPNAPEDKHRLPLNVKPLHYDITIRTDLEKLTFEGSVAIESVAFSFSK